MLLFQLELVELQKGVPEGFLFVWLGDGPDPLFPAMDLDGDGRVPLDEVGAARRSAAPPLRRRRRPSVRSQFSAFIRLQVQEGRGRLRPGVQEDAVLRDMFDNQDQNRDGQVTEDELRPREEGRAEEAGRDEL